MPKKNDRLTDRRQKKIGNPELLPGGRHGLFVNREQFNQIQTPKMPAFDSKWNSHWRPVLPSEILHDGPKHVLFHDRRLGSGPETALPKPDLRPPIKTPPKEDKIDMLRRHFRAAGFKEHEIDAELNKESWRKKKND